MARIFSWKQTDSVDAELLDRQHQALFKVVRELYDALSRAAGLEVAEDVFSRLVDYSLNHFQTEESLMEKQQPPFKTHRVKHRDFTSELRTVRKDFQLGNKGVLVNLLLYLQQWIKNHTQGADHEHAKFLKARGERRELESKDG